MKTSRHLTVILAFSAVAYAGGSLDRHEKMERLGECKMKNATTEEGFEFFSGHLDTGEYPTNFLTVYSHRVDGVPKLTIIGNNVKIEKDLRDFDEVVQLYKTLVMEKYTD